MEEVEVWLARDDYGALYAHIDKPKKDVRNGLWGNGFLNSNFIELPQESFPNIKYSDKEPTKAKITLIK